MSRARGDGSSLPNAELELVVDLINLAELDGMPPHYAASRLALNASSLLDAGIELKGGPSALLPDVLARRILSLFRLSAGRAVEVARQLRMDDRQVPDEDLRALRDLKWVLPDLEMLGRHVTDRELLSAVNKWTSLSRALEE